MYDADSHCWQVFQILIARTEEGARKKADAWIEREQERSRLAKIANDRKVREIEAGEVV